MFKKGDQLICIEGCNTLILYKTYTALENSSNGWVSVINEEGDRSPFFTHRFKKSETQMKYEDWQLAKQGVTIPENSITLPGPDGSIVAFKAPIAPKVVTLKRLLKLDAFTFNTIGMGHGSREYDHILSFDKVDGVIDCSSVKLEKRDV